MPTTAATGTYRASGRTISEQFHSFHARHPHVYRSLERMTARRLAAGATRVSLKHLFEDLRRDLPDGIAGLDNNFTALYARLLIGEHPRWAAVFELRRRRAA
ncbi:hypothetical protein [Streptomyces acidiscabies]|uniref:Uncharacterized protein n=1 Tax=Streptomyces acidiscabies TaxID=42234 RepID=A0AAP6BJ14_9ACTN|nr:hypothetical protein [Streptomyces acidiscabies]MBP5935399.1 hypothetical protein [Streptomyces sp. LBUM 1476]MBZ3916751.1 hypothetical protein [Streptomyces acidiscabies]MDX2965611.1 hypothetical protein [Streptomyces acidiscabies]MDX3024887.1 hypothetical protein [Streptomyces acidiscabies]MDX3795527.1 hypothetical protein [Streptomyces acidiscabies]